MNGFLRYVCAFFTAAAVLAAAFPAAASARQAGPLPAGPAVAAPPAAAFEPAAPQAPGAVQYYDGAIQYSTITNCFSIIQGVPYNEFGMGTYVGFSADPQAALPGPGQKYYVHIVIAGMGNSCAGQYAAVELALPASTSLAIDASTPVRCFYNGAPLAPCPQSLPASSYHPGAYRIPSSDAAHANTWGVVQGKFLEFQVPVISSTTLSNSTLTGYILALDGNFSPWLQPAQGVYVFSSTPAVLYPSPSTERLGSPVTGYKSTTWVYNHGLAGNVYFDLGTTPSYGEFTDGPAVIPPPGQPAASAYTAWSDWTPHPLAANTTYHWRARFVTASQTYYGADQTFTTAANGQVKMGTGTGASCTPAALTTALGTPGIQVLTFDCGAEPVTIPIANAWQVGINFTIDGGNKVTLQGNNTFRLFDVLNGGVLTLNNVDLAGGTVSGCGAGIHVSSGGRLYTSSVRLTNNHATGTGGGLCVEAGGQAGLNNTLISASSATGDGGGIWNAGIIDARWGDVSGNTSGGNGGGTWNSGIIFFGNSLVSGNAAPTGQTRSGAPTLGGGGGIFNTGSLDLYTTTVANNTASFGGGILNNAGTVTLTSTTIAANSASAGGKPLFAAAQAGGYESSLGGSTTVRNTIIAGNLVPGVVEGNCGTSPSKTITSLGRNLDGGSQCLFTQPTDHPNTNPLLNPLGNNGGKTRTMALRSGSLAIDQADNTYCGMYDQRGFSGPTPPGDILQRAVDANGDGLQVCDIGAFEYRPMLYIPIGRK